jgi:hypothetical protein
MILALTSDIYNRGQLYDAASTIIQQSFCKLKVSARSTSAAARCPPCAWSKSNFVEQLWLEPART